MTTNSSHLAEQTIRLAAAIFEPSDRLEFRILPKREQRYCFARDVGDQLAYLVAQNAEANRQSIYFGVNPRKRDGGKKNDVALARCYVTDHDGGATLESIRASVEALGIPEPSAINLTGHGGHAYWFMDEPLTELPLWTARQKLLIAALGTDPKIHDWPRVLRAPGFTNWKADPVPSEMVTCDHGRRYRWEDLAKPLSSGQHFEDAPAKTPATAEGWNILGKYVAKAGGNNRNSVGTDLACQLRDGGISLDEAERIMVAFADAVPQGDHAYAVGEALQTVKSIYQSPAREPARAPIKHHELPQWIQDLRLRPHPRAIPTGDCGQMPLAGCVWFVGRRDDRF